LLSGFFDINGNGRLRTGASRGSAGFTLAEVIIVVLILSVMAAIVAPSFLGSLNQKRMNQATSNLLNLLRYARQKAVVEQESKTVVIDIDKGNYWMVHLVKDRKGRVKGSKKYYANGVPKGHRITSVYKPKLDQSYTSDEVRIVFYPDGTAESVRILVRRDATKGTKPREEGIKVDDFNAKPRMMEPDECLDIWGPVSW
jgi:prepilin-type N-terminal cleavage/methylation domain-containing protein